MKITKNKEGLFYKDGNRYKITREKKDTQLPHKYAYDNGYDRYTSHVNRLERYIEQGIDVEQVKTKQIAKIKRKRDLEYTSNLITSDGLHFKSDLETIIDVQQIISILPDGGTYEGYKNADGSYNDITKEQFVTALSEGVARKGAVFIKEKTLVDAVNAADTIEDVLSVNW